jgi:hypothetical protein
VKVSKPVLIFGIVVLLLAGYIFFFTGKKKTAVPVAPVPPVSGQAQPVQQGQPTLQPPSQAAPPSPAKTFPSEPAAKGGQPEVTPAAVKPDFDKVKRAWVKNPFILPQFKEEKKKETTPAVRLSAIFEKGKDRVAIIDHEVVRKGDPVGDEKVFEIERDKVILIRSNGAKRVLSLASIEDTVIREEEPKTKATEKGK